MLPNAALSGSTVNRESSAKSDGFSLSIPSLVAEPASNITRSNNSNMTTKLVILSFDDNKEGDFTYSKPILDKYGFKATFFVICGKNRFAKRWHGYRIIQ
jgi:peptidoglycan/xylan/chitin deacetylase (PgdA/CDA1 family)